MVRLSAALLLAALLAAAGVCASAREVTDLSDSQYRRALLARKHKDEKKKGPNSGDDDSQCKGRGCDPEDDDDRDDEDETHGDDVVTLSSEYKVILRSGDVCEGCAPGNKDYTWGGMYERNTEKPIYSIKSNGEPDVAGGPQTSNNPDFFSLLKFRKNEAKAIVQFESPSPSALWMADLHADRKGELDWDSFHPIDTSEWGGLQGTCAGSVTPWNSHLGSEENCPNARALEAGYKLADDVFIGNMSTYSGILPQMRFFGIYPKQLTAGVYKKFYNPYNYGHFWEVKIDKKGRESLTKIYNLPRMSSEMAYVMPDRKTVYGCDDAANGAFYKMVYDQPGDLTGMGTLYALKAVQRPSTVGTIRGNFQVTWIKMGRANHRQIYSQRNLRFSDIFDSETPNPLPSFTNATFIAQCKANGGCKGGCPTAGFVEIQSDTGRECLKVKPGKENIAAFLESRRYAPYVGATSEFSKWEGFTFDPKQRKIYTAISYQRYGMEDYGREGGLDGRYDVGGNNAVRLKHENCGGVYIMDVDSKYSAYNLYTKDALMGKTVQFTSGSNYECEESRIANPDNVNFIKDHATLVIGEDGDGHIANSAWSYNVNTDELTPILRSPAGGEITGNFYWHDIALQGYSYQGVVVQHPDAPVKAPVGYMGPFKLKKGQEIEFERVARR